MAMQTLEIFIALVCRLFSEVTMYFVTAKVLLFRYLYMMRQRWLLTISYLLFPLILCFLVAWYYDDLPLMKYEIGVQENDERSLLRLPERGNCTGNGSNVCQLSIVVCPGGEKERQLMDIVARMLRLSDNTTALDITYVNNSDRMVKTLVSPSSNASRGLFFHQISATKLEYTIRPLARNIPVTLYDWGDYATTQKFPSPMLRGPRLTDPYFNVEDQFITLAGLLPLQVAVDKAYLEIYFPNFSKEWILTSFPYPPFYELTEQLRPFLSHRFCLILVQYTLMMGIAFMIMVLASYNIRDKHSGIREWLHLNGALRFMVNISWLTSFCLEAVILAFLEMCILRIPTENGPTLKYMSASVLMLVLVVHNCMSLCWANLLSIFFSKQYICILIIAAYWVFSPVLQWIPPDRFTMQGILAILPNAGHILIFKSFQEYDGAETVLDLDHLYVSPIHYLPVGILLLIMFMTSVLLILLSMCVDLVKPGKYGRAVPLCHCWRKEKVPAYGFGDEASNDERYFEKFSSEDPIALECVSISKFLNKNKAVDSINMKILKNKITVLLGHNGAGKTTLLSILCGMNFPSMGHLHTVQYDVFQSDNLKKFRKVMGYCPQYNWLMGELNIKQHCIIFGLLKGLSRVEAENYCEELTAAFDMQKFQLKKASQLSGGTKRKLCLAIAMIGHPQYLFLDEPSSGLDAESTKKFWQILLQEKRDCTVVLSTHDMEEAEVLGDCIATMYKGRLKGYSTSSFLKKQLDIGYKINCAINELDVKKLILFVKSVDPSTKILYLTKHGVTFGVRIEKSKDLPSLMRSLESEFGEKIALSLLHVSMDDVFIKLQPELHLQDNPEIVQVVKNKVLNKHSTGRLETLMTQENGINRLCNRGEIIEIFKKKMKWICNRKMPAIILLLVIPIIGIFLAMYFVNKVIGSPELNSADLVLTADKYSGSTVFVARRTDAITSALIQALDSNGVRFKEVFTKDMDHYLNAKAKKDLFAYRSKMVFAFDSGEKVSDSSTAYYSRNAFHSAPIAYSTLMNAMLLGNATITTHNFPVEEEHEGSSCSGVNVILVTIIFEILLGPILLITGSYFIIFPRFERQTLFKHLQLMTGLLPSVYWISHLMFDMLMLSISFLLIISILAIMDNGLFLNPEVLSAFIIVLILYGISTIIFAYACSFCRCSISTIVILFVEIPPLLLFGYLLLRFIVPGIQIFLRSELLNFLPWVILMKSLYKITHWAGNRRLCHQCNDLGACSVVETDSLIRSLKTELLSFVIISLVYYAFIVVVDHGFGRKIKSMYDRLCCYGDLTDVKDVDADVAHEKRLVMNFQKDENEDRPELICDGLGKKYSSKVTAVRDVSFAVERGELFGLLGGNGAGKSTLFGMLSGLISPTKGVAVVRNKWDLSDCEYRYIRNIGYCPQFQGYLPELSGRNTLQLFGRFRGLEPPLLDSHVDSWLQALDMVSIADQPCEWYSGGNLRKLSFAIAMIGSPSVVLLDEPTTGVDPVVRKRIWSILMNSLKHQHQAIILSSHTMSECEAICDRLTIMVDGEMKCLGPVHQLKNKFGKSCTLHVKMRANATPKQVEAIQSKILEQSQFSRYAHLKEKQLSRLSFIVKTDKMKIHDVFANMLKIKDENPVIEDFSLADTPLEEIFMAFAHQKSSQDRAFQKPQQFKNNRKD